MAIPHEWVQAMGEISGPISDIGRTVAMVDTSDDLLDDLCHEHESLSQETQKAECLRTSSDSEEEENSRSPLWWVQLLHQHVPSRMPRKLRLRILSGCTGLCAEAAVLKVWVG